MYFYLMNKVYLSLGTNMGNREQHLKDARLEIDKKLGIITNQSSVIETTPWGVENQENYLNQVICIQTELAPLPLLQVIHQIEKGLGRIRKQKWEARIIDIDIIFYNDEIIEEQSLTIPHPLMHIRQFVLEPLDEIAPGYIHPRLQKTITELLQNLPDEESDHIR